MTRLPLRAIKAGSSSGRGSRNGGAFGGGSVETCAAVSYEGGGSFGAGTYLVSAIALMQ